MELGLAIEEGGISNCESLRTSPLNSPAHPLRSHDWCAPHVVEVALHWHPLLGPALQTGYLLRPLKLPWQPSVSQLWDGSHGTSSILALLLRKIEDLGYPKMSLDQDPEMVQEISEGLYVPPVGADPAVNLTGAWRTIKVSWGPIPDFEMVVADEAGLAHTPAATQSR